MGNRKIARYAAVLTTVTILSTSGGIAAAQESTKETSVSISDIKVEYQPIKLEDRVALGMTDFVKDKIATGEIQAPNESQDADQVVQAPDQVKKDDKGVDQRTSDAVSRARQAISDFDAAKAAQEEQRKKAEQAAQLQEKAIASLGSSSSSPLSNNGTSVYNDEGSGRVLPPVLSSQMSPGEISSSIPGELKGTAAAKVLEAAYSQLGVPYVWGGTSPNSGLDCSGLTQYAYSQAGISLPRVTYDQINAGTRVSLNDLKPGDLLFPADTSHVSIYVGDGNVIHAPQTGDVVKITPLQYMSVTTAVRII